MLGCLSQLSIWLLIAAQVLIQGCEFKPHVGLHTGHGASHRLTWEHLWIWWIQTSYIFFPHRNNRRPSQAVGYILEFILQQIGGLIYYSISSVSAFSKLNMVWQALWPAASVPQDHRKSLWGSAMGLSFPHWSWIPVSLENVIFKFQSHFFLQVHLPIWGHSSWPALLKFSARSLSPFRAPAYQVLHTERLLGHMKCHSSGWRNKGFWLLLICEGRISLFFSVHRL